MSVPKFQTKEYLVEKILDKRIKDRKAEYKVKWQGYSNKDCTWEPICNLVGVLQMVDEYENNITDPKNDQNFEYLQIDEVTEESSSVSLQKETREEQIQEKVISRYKTPNAPKIAKGRGCCVPIKLIKPTKNIKHQQKQQSQKDKGIPLNRTRSKAIRIKPSFNLNRRSPKLLLTKPKCPSTSTESEQSCEEFNKELQNMEPVDITSSSEEVTEKILEEKRSRQPSASLTRRQNQFRSRSRSLETQPKIGSFQRGDKAQEVLKIRKDFKNKKVEFLVKWEKRTKGIKPNSSWVNEDSMNKNASVLLSKYLLDKIKWAN